MSDTPPQPFELKPAPEACSTPYPGSASLGYVDKLRVQTHGDAATRRAGRRWGHRWCHLWADDLETLHRVAAAAGMRREWFQDDPRLPHYDLTPARRGKLVARGLVVEMCLRRWLAGRRATSNAELRHSAGSAASQTQKPNNEH